MTPFSILYIGVDSGTSYQRVLALRRLGHDVVTIDPFSVLPHRRISGLWAWKSGGLFLEGLIRRRVLASIPRGEFDLVFVSSGELIGPRLVAELKQRFGTVINYDSDDPFGRRDGQRWRLFLQAVPFYDMIAVVRDCNVAEAYAAGARRVLRVHRSADEVAHAPRHISEEDDRKWAAEVCFIGTWMPERGPFMARLIELGVPLTIYGGRWQKAREWATLRPSWRGPQLGNDDYAKAIQCAKVTLGLLSKGNRDLVTRRSFEIPYLGGVLCAERTSEHLKLYREDEEAVFWSTPEECAEKCMKLLADEERRKYIARNGRHRCLHNGTTNHVVLTQMLEHASALDDGSTAGFGETLSLAQS